MVSLDEQIQKDKQKHRSQRSGKQHSRPNERRVKNFNRGPTDKRRGIRKDDRRRDNRRFNRQDTRGPRRVQRHDREKGNRVRPQRQEDRQRSRISRDNKGRSRISRAPRKTSTEAPAEVAQEKGRTLKVMGLHPDFTNEDLYKLFSTEGALQKCLIEQDNFGRSLTTAIVKYHNASSAKSAITNLNQHKVMNSILTVEPYKNKRR